MSLLFILEQPWRSEEAPHPQWLESLPGFEQPRGLFQSAQVLHKTLVRICMLKVVRS